MNNHKSYLLKGRVVTMDGDNVIHNGYVHVDDGIIVGVYEHKQAGHIRSADPNLTVIETNSSIYPGLIDLHNHLVYNVLPLWVVPSRYGNRSQWPRHPDYKAGISLPIRNALARYSPTAKALVRYVETKALLGGTTTGQGMRTRVHGGSKMFVGAMRNVEEPLSDDLPPAGSRVPDLIVTGGTAAERIADFRRALNRDGQGAYFYHLSEGVDQRAHQHFVNLKDYDLISEKLVGIHALGLTAADLQHLASRGAKLVWSPFSNQLLYGSTMDLQALKDSGISFSIGCDWSPSGSKNLLQELKVAALANRAQGNPFSDYELVNAVTAEAAKVTAWHNRLGKITIGKYADLIVVNDGRDNDPYRNLIAATEKDIQLVVVGGRPKYGKKSWMETLLADQIDTLETLDSFGDIRALHLVTLDSAINDISFGDARHTLTEAMADLYGYIERMEQRQVHRMAFGGDPIEEFVVELDNEFSFAEDALRVDDPADPAELFADVSMVPSVELDEPTVIGQAYWDRVSRQPNLSDELKSSLKHYYDVR